MRTNLLIGAAAALMATSASALGWAQEQQTHRPDRAQFEQRMQQHREQRLADIRQMLRLRPDQEAAFQAYVASMKPPSRPDGRDRAAAGALTTPEMIARRTERGQRMKAEMDRRDQATLAFYRALDPEQQKTFDAMVRERHGGHGGWGMDRGRHHMGNMGPGGHRDAPPPPPQ